MPRIKDVYLLAHELAVELSSKRHLCWPRMCTTFAARTVPLLSCDARAPLITAYARILMTRCTYEWHRTFSVKVCCLFTQDKFSESPPLPPSLPRQVVLLPSKVGAWSSTDEAPAVSFHHVPARNLYGCLDAGKCCRLRVMLK